LCSPPTTTGFASTSMGSQGNAASAITVMVVDDHPLMREGIVGVIEGQLDMRVVAEASNGAEAVRCFREHRPCVTLMDVRMPEINGIDAVSAIRADYWDERVIVLASYRRDVQALRAIRPGAWCCLHQSRVLKDLLPR